jgi:16S rRNA A1518/A1519 N6-dimethyltransferase RsmA/KsgA/DIM1 with predicted DNA glycosylase/AP lyase activity
MKLINRVIAEIPFRENAVVYELGSGDGRFLRNLAKSKKVQAIGYENFIVPYVIGRIFNYFTHSTVESHYGDFYKADLSKADYIFCYLVPNQMDKLEAKLQKEAKPGTLIISNTFKFKNWPLEKEIILNEKNQISLSNKIYLYRKV